MSERVTVAIEDGIARIHIDDGKVNPLSSSLFG